MQQRAALKSTCTVQSGCTRFSVLTERRVVILKWKTECVCEKRDMTARTQRVTGKDKELPQSRATEVMVRVRRGLWLVVAMFTLSLLLVVLGLYATTRTESLNVSGYTSGVILTLGSFLGLLGLFLEENRKQLLMAAILFLSFGIVTSFLCVVIDGTCIVLNMDIRPLKAERCQFYSSGSSYLYENFYTSVSCWHPVESCNMTIRSGTCYCCDLYNCANGGYLNNYYEFVGVQSCEEVFTLYILIWILTGLNLTAFFTGILTTAVLGSIKHLRSSSAVTGPSTSTASSPSAPLLPDASKSSVHQVHPIGSVYFPQAEEAAASQCVPSAGLTKFTPLTNLLPSRADAGTPPATFPHN